MLTRRRKEPERWARAPGFPKYDVSTHGRVRKRLGKGEYKDVSPLVKLRGFTQVHLRLGPKRRRNVGLAVLVLTAFVGPCPRGHRHLHRDGDLTNCRLDNLAWRTREEWKAYQLLQFGTRWGRATKRSGRPRLTPEAVADILASNLGVCDLAKKHRDDHGHVSSVRQRLYAGAVAAGARAKYGDAAVAVPTEYPEAVVRPAEATA